MIPREDAVPERRYRIRIWPPSPVSRLLFGVVVAAGVSVLGGPSSTSFVFGAVGGGVAFLSLELSARRAGATLGVDSLLVNYGRNAIKIPFSALVSAVPDGTKIRLRFLEKRLASGRPSERSVAIDVLDRDGFLADLQARRSAQDIGERTNAVASRWRQVVVQLGLGVGLVAVIVVGEALIHIWR
jgi:hypothetical protein